MEVVDLASNSRVSKFGKRLFKFGNFAVTVKGLCSVEFLISEELFTVFGVLANADTLLKGMFCPTDALDELKFAKTGNILAITKCVLIGCLPIKLSVLDSLLYGVLISIDVVLNLVGVTLFIIVRIAFV